MNINFGETIATYIQSKAVIDSNTSPLTPKPQDIISTFFSNTLKRKKFAQVASENTPENKEKEQKQTIIWNDKHSEIEKRHLQQSEKENQKKAAMDKLWLQKGYDALEEERVINRELLTAVGKAVGQIQKEINNKSKAATTINIPSTYYYSPKELEQNRINIEKYTLGK